MSFCDHCEGQRFDRARILRLLRKTRVELRASMDKTNADEIVTLLVEAIRALDIPHMEIDVDPDEVIH